MATNMALKRGRKAQKRKQVVAQKRGAGVLEGGTPPPWSQSIGFPTHRDFAAVERMFGDVSADASDAVLRFGRDGKPVYIPGPYDSDPLIQRRIQHLQKYLGDDGFGFVTAA